MITGKKVRISAALVLGIVILINILSSRFFLRLDFTEDQRYSLSDATKNILSDLEEPVTITAYFSEDLPPDVMRVRQDFKDLLTEYGNYSDDQVVYEFVNPNKDQDAEMKAQQNGISPIMINMRERDQMKQQRAYLGAVIQMGEKKEVIPFIQPGAAMEYALSTGIKKISVNEKPVLGLLQGNGEAGLGAIQQLHSQLSVLYDIENVNVSDSSGIPANIKTLLIIAPKDSLSENHFRELDNFLSTGGRILAAVNIVEGNLSQGMGEKVNTNIMQWLLSKGLDIKSSFITDVNCGSVMVRRQQGMFVMNTPVEFPYLPVISKFADHPVTKGLESVILPFASEIKVVSKDSSVKYTILATTSDKSGSAEAPLYFDITKDWTAQDFQESYLPVAVAAEGKLSGNAHSRMVVIGDGDFAVNGEGQDAQQLQPDNVNLMANAIDWLCDDTGLVELRTKGVTARPLDTTLEAGTRTFIKYLNFLLPIIVIIIYGVFRFQLNKRKRNKLMSVNYV